MKEEIICERERGGERERKGKIQGEKNYVELFVVL